MVCSHLATSKTSTSSSQCRLISSAAFSSTASDVFHARSRCTRADPPVATALQLLPHRARPPCTPTQSRPELAQREHRHALYAVALHAVILHAVALHAVIPRSYSCSSCCRTRARPGLAAPLLRTPEPRAPLARAAHVPQPPFFCSHAATPRPQLHLHLRAPARSGPPAPVRLRRAPAPPSLQHCAASACRSRPHARACAARASACCGPAPARLTHAASLRARSRRGGDKGGGKREMPGRRRTERGKTEEKEKRDFPRTYAQI
jgi:hypothetical protein